MLSQMGSGVFRVEESSGKILPRSHVSCREWSSALDPCLPPGPILYSYQVNVISFCDPAIPRFPSPDQHLPTAMLL